MSAEIGAKRFNGSALSQPAVPYSGATARERTFPNQRSRSTTETRQ